MAKKITSATLKNIGVPKTQQEKYERLKKINPVIDKLKSEFFLEIEL